MCLSLFIHLPQLDAQLSCEFRDMKEPIDLPGCIPIHEKYLLDPVQERTNEAYKWVLHHAERNKLAEDIMVNTFNELEEGALKFLTKHEPGKPLVFPVGPLVRIGSSEDNDYESDSLKLLDDQPRGNPGDSTRNPMNFLPGGFLDRTKERGLVIGTWAPQAEILSHSSIGGFMTHYGWNSILESMVHGVPLITWPLYAEKKMNAVMLTEGLKIALKPNHNKKELIGRGEIVTVVKGLMEGEDGKNIRHRMKDLKGAAIIAMGEDGSSTMAILEVVQKWRSHLK